MQTKKKSPPPIPSKKRALPGPTERIMLWQTLNEKGDTSLDADGLEWRKELIYQRLTNSSSAVPSQYADA
jgi:hypothetical protein